MEGITKYMFVNRRGMLKTVGPKHGVVSVRYDEVQRGMGKTLSHGVGDPDSKVM